MVIRFFLISSHYRKSINYSLDTISQAEKNYNKILTTIKKINDAPTQETDSDEINKLISKIELSRQNIINAMDDDFNTPVAIAEIMTLIRDLNQATLESNTALNEQFKDKFFSYIEDIDNIFGLFPNLQEQLTKKFDKKDELIKNLLDLFKDTRSSLRERKLYDISDKIRERLRALGINVEDN
ncbi:MAG: DALR domain-containing protein [Promethearchaeota archaeon]